MVFIYFNPTFYCFRCRADTVPILTSTVIECHRVGFQKAAFSYASMLMRSENRSQIDQKYAKKIEAIVRKAPNGIKDAEDSYQNETNPCPICDCKLQIMELSCHQCKTNLPMCIATVRFFLLKSDSRSIRGKRGNIILFLICVWSETVQKEVSVIPSHYHPKLRGRRL